MLCRYEATLGTSGIMQVGWATVKCSFTTEEGVGDTWNSYSYDGKRRLKWHINEESYGEAWAPGDVVSACIDLDSREVRASECGHALHLHLGWCTTGMT